MKSTDAILLEIEQLPTRERAAAIAHYIYVKTAERIDWGRRVPVEWRQLSAEARAFNLASTETWATELGLYEAWCEALQQLRSASSEA